jgi:hypothetical protein
MSGSARLACVALLVVGCARLRTTNVDAQRICRLMRGDVAAWHGLPAAHLHRSELPDCLGPIIGTDVRMFSVGRYDVERHDAGSTGRVDVFGWPGDGRVIAIDVWPPKPIDAAALLAELPPPDRSYRYEPAELDTWGVVPPAGAAVDEVVWGARGLALVMVRGAPGDEVVRMRGFEPMPADRWIEGFVQFFAIPEQ